VKNYKRKSRPQILGDGIMEIKRVLPAEILIKEMVPKGRLGSNEAPTLLTYCYYYYF
jgi:hypothetical protein